MFWQGSAATCGHGASFMPKSLASMLNSSSGGSGMRTAGNNNNVAVVFDFVIVDCNNNEGPLLVTVTRYRSFACNGDPRVYTSHAWSSVELDVRCCARMCTRQGHTALETKSTSYAISVASCEHQLLSRYRASLIPEPRLPLHRVHRPVQARSQHPAMYIQRKRI
jgi:hypothetical protein